MAKDSAIQNQKVFITLHAVVELTTEYNRVKEEFEQTRKSQGITSTHNTWAQRKAALEYVIRTLDLPINI